MKEEFSNLSIDFEQDKDRHYYFTTEDPDEVTDEHFFKNPVQKCESNPNSKIGYAYHPDMQLHKNKETHCERPERIRAIDYQLDKSKLKSYLNHITVDEANEDHAKYVHDQEYLNKLNQNTEDQFTGFKTGGDIYTNEHSKRAAYLALGANIKACDMVLNG